MYDPRSRERVYLSQITYKAGESDVTYSFLGSIASIGTEKHQQISDGLIHPITHDPFDQSVLLSMEAVSTEALKAAAALEATKSTETVRQIVALMVAYQASYGPDTDTDDEACS